MLRRAGKSRREIRELLAIGSNATLNEALRGEPPQPWARRPNAKNGACEAARELRRRGLDYNRIAAELGVSKSSVSLWVRDLPRPPRLSYEECRRRQAEGVRRYWDTERGVREAEREVVRTVAAARIGTLSDREVLIGGAIAYWCEGAKSKSYRRADRVVFVNSDPGLIAFFLRFLDVAGIARERLTYRVQIHETADAEAAQRFWLDVTGADPAQFRRPSLKRHNPRTVGMNTGDGYHGCLRLEVMRSAGLYREIEGRVRAAVTGQDKRPGELASGTRTNTELPGEDSNLG